MDDGIATINDRQTPDRSEGKHTSFQQQETSSDRRSRPSTGNERSPAQQQQQQHNTNTGGSGSSPYDDQHPSSGRARSTSNRGGGGGGGNSSGRRTTRLLIPLRTQPVTIPPPPFRPPANLYLKPQICPASASAKPKFMQGLDKLAEQGSQKRERVSSACKSRQKDKAGISHEQWKTVQHEQGFFDETLEKNPHSKRASNSPPRRLVLEEKQREAIVERLSRVPVKRTNLPPLKERDIREQDEIDSIVERLSEPFEKKLPPEPERRIVDDEEIDDINERMFYQAVQRQQEKEEKIKEKWLFKPAAVSSGRGKKSSSAIDDE